MPASPRRGRGDAARGRGLRLQRRVGAGQGWPGRRRRPGEVVSRAAASTRGSSARSVSSCTRSSSRAAAAVMMSGPFCVPEQPKRCCCCCCCRRRRPVHRVCAVVPFLMGHPGAGSHAEVAKRPARPAVLGVGQAIRQGTDLPAGPRSQTCPGDPQRQRQVRARPGDLLCRQQVGGDAAPASQRTEQRHGLVRPQHVRVKAMAPSRTMSTRWLVTRTGHPGLAGSSGTMTTGLADRPSGQLVTRKEVPAGGEDPPAGSLTAPW